MDPISEIQFRAEKGQVLSAALRAALGKGRRPPPHHQVVEWISSGFVRVDDEVVRDPQQLLVVGARVELAAWSGPAAPIGELATPEVEAIQYLDQHVLVAEYTPPPRVDGMASVAGHLARLLAEAGIHDRLPVPVPDHEARASGLVAAAIVLEGVPGLDIRHKPLGVRVAVKALVREAPDADLEDLSVKVLAPGVMQVRTPPVESTIQVLEDLEARGLEVMEVETDAPPGHRPLLLHAVSMALTHPQTGRTTMWACGSTPDFKAALAEAKARGKAARGA